MKVMQLSCSVRVRQPKMPCDRQIVVTIFSSVGQSARDCTNLHVQTQHPKMKDWEWSIEDSLI
jgi:hypothetical protein